MNTEQVKEAIETGVEAVSVNIPVRVTMTSYNNAPFEFTPSIDEVGQIILTPTSKDVEFIDANTDANVDFDVPVIEQETIETVEGSITTKETSILIKASMLAEVENCAFSAVVDEIGQVVIYPLSEKNVFVTASFEDSLNLVTEDMENVDYFGYKLVNTGDGWDVYDYTNELIEEGVATLAEAKILVCTTEIHRIEELTEDVQKQETEQIDAEGNPDTTVEQPEVTAEVLDEAVVDATIEPDTFNPREIAEALKTITDEFTEDSGAVMCDTEQEKRECSEILSTHYVTVNVDKKDNKWVVSYKDIIQSAEANNND